MSKHNAGSSATPSGNNHSSLQHNTGGNAGRALQGGAAKVGETYGKLDARVDHHGAVSNATDAIDSQRHGRDRNQVNPSKTRNAGKSQTGASK